MSLQIWLPLNGNLKNKGCNTANPVQSTAPTYVNGKLGKAMAGGAFYLPAADVAKFYNNSAMSFAFWIYPMGSSSGGQVIIGKNDMSAGDNRMFSIFQYPNPVDIHLSWQNETSSSTFLAGTFSNVLTASTWNHVAVTYNGSTATLYVNGTQAGTLNGTSNRTNFSYNVPVPNNTTTRYLSDIRIYNHCLSVAEVKELAKGLVCHYKLDAIGLENLLAYSKVNNTNKTLLKNNISSNWNNLSIVTIDGYQGYHYPSATGPTGWCSGYWYKSLEANTTYTYSAWIYFTANANFNFTSLGHFQVYNSGSSASDKSHEDVVASRIYEPSSIKANTWTKVRITFTTNSLAGSHFQIYPRYNIAANTGDLYFRDCKLEKNNNATQWLPNSIDNEYKGLGYDSTAIIDSSGNGYNATKGGTLTASTDTLRYSLSTKFVDNNSNITLTPFLSSGQTVTEISVSCWYKTNTLNSTVPNLWSLGENSFLRIRLASSTSMWFYAKVGSTMKGYVHDIGKSLIDNTWHHVVLTFKNGIFVLYVDGVQIATDDASGTATYLTCSGVGSTWHLGGYSTSSEKYVGQLSDFRIYTTALSADNVKRLHNTSASVSKNGSLLGYEFNEVT